MTMPPPIPNTPDSTPAAKPITSSSASEGFGITVPRSPPRRFAGELLVEIRGQRREVINDRGRVHLFRPGQRLELLGPRLRHAHLEHRVQALSRFLALVNRAAVERRGAAGDLGQRAMELELQNAGDEI